MRREAGPCASRLRSFVAQNTTPDAAFPIALRTTGRWSEQSILQDSFAYEACWPLLKLLQLVHQGLVRPGGNFRITLLIGSLSLLAGCHLSSLIAMRVRLSIQIDTSCDHACRRRDEDKSSSLTITCYASALWQ